MYTYEEKISASNRLTQGHSGRWNVRAAEGTGIPRGDSHGYGTV